MLQEYFFYYPLSLKFWKQCSSDKFIPAFNVFLRWTFSGFFLLGFSFTGTDNLEGSRRREGNSFLFLSTSSTCSETFKNLHSTLQVRWLSRIFNRITCNNQTTTRWDLPPWRITIWLIDDWILISIHSGDDVANSS